MEIIQERAFEFCPSAGMVSSDPKVFQRFNLKDKNQSLAYASEKEEISEMRGLYQYFLKDIPTYLRSAASYFRWSLCIKKGCY